MVFVKPTKNTLLLVPVIHKIGAIMTFITLMMFVVYMIEPMIRIKSLPQVERGNPYFNVYQHFPKFFEDSEINRLFFNTLLVALFWL